MGFIIKNGRRFGRLRLPRQDIRTAWPRRDGHLAVRLDTLSSERGRVRGRSNDKPRADRPLILSRVRLPVQEEFLQLAVRSLAGTSKPEIEDRPLGEN